MTDAPNIIVESVEGVAQQSGKQVFWDQGPRPYWTQAHTAGGINTCEKDLVAGDIGCMWDSGESTPRALLGFGDVFGTNHFPGGTMVAPNGNMPRIASGSGGTDGLAAPFAFNAATLNGSATVQLELHGGIGGWNSYGYASIEVTGGVPGGWVIFAYYGLRTSGAVTAWIDNCYWICGSGTITAGAEVRNGDPRTGGGFRANAIATSTDQALSTGFTIDDVYSLFGANLPSWEPWGGHVYTPDQMWSSAVSQTGAWKNQVFVAPSAWVSGTTYIFGDSVTHSGVVYTTNSAGVSTVAPPSDAARWIVSDRSNYYALGHVEGNGWNIEGRTASTAIDAGVGAATRPKPIRVPVIFGGVPLSSTTLASATFAHTAVPSSITVANASAGSGYCATAKTSEQKRFAVESTTGGYIVIAYTTRTGNVLSGCSWVRGTGTAKAAGKCLQGHDTLDGLAYGEFPLFDVAHDGNPLSFRIQTFGQHRAGGDWTGAFVFQAYNRYADTGSAWYDTNAGQREGNVVLGGCSVSLAGAPAWVSGTSYTVGQAVTSVGIVYRCGVATSGTTPPASDGAHWSRPSSWDNTPNDRRQLAFVLNNWANLNGSFAQTAVDVWYSDTGGRTWSKSAMRWEGTPECNALIASATPWAHTDGYVYARTSPLNHVMRVTAASFRDTAPGAWSTSTWTHWIDGTGWRSTPPANATDVTNAKRWDDTSYVDASFGYSAAFGCWYSFYLGFGEIVVRFAADPQGPWGPARTVITSTFLGASQGWPYGGWVHPFSGLYGNDTDALFVNVTAFGCYQLFMLKVNLKDLGDVAMPEVKRRYTQHLAGSRDETPWLIDPTFEGYDGWIDSPDIWTRISPTSDASGSCPTFTTPGNAVQVARYSKGCRLSWQETSGTWKYGTVKSASHSAGTCTVILVAQNDHQMNATPVVGDTVPTFGQGPRYSYEASPEGYPQVWRFISPTKTGFTATTDLCYFSIVGNRIHFDAYLVGTSSATPHSMAMPVALLQPTETWGLGYGLNSATSVVLAAQWGNYSGGYTCTLNNSTSATAWTTGGVATHKRFTIEGQF